MRTTASLEQESSFQEGDGDFFFLCVNLLFVVFFAGGATVER